MCWTYYGPQCLEVRTILKRWVSSIPEERNVIVIVVVVATAAATSTIIVADIVISIVVSIVACHLLNPPSFSSLPSYPSRSASSSLSHSRPYCLYSHSVRIMLLSVSLMTSNWVSKESFDCFDWNCLVPAVAVFDCFPTVISVDVDFFLIEWIYAEDLHIVEYEYSITKFQCSLSWTRKLKLLIAGVQEANKKVKILWVCVTVWAVSCL